MATDTTNILPFEEWLKLKHPNITFSDEEKKLWYEVYLKEVGQTNRTGQWNYNPNQYSLLALQLLFQAQMYGGNAGNIISGISAGMQVFDTINLLKNLWGDLSNVNRAAGISQVSGLFADMGRLFLFGNLLNTDSMSTNISNLTYDAISNTAMMFGPVGTVIGGAMKVGAFTGDMLQSIGGGTDLKTGTDRLMDSSFFSWNIGAINGFGGKRTSDFSADYSTLEKVGGSYGGSANNILKAQEYAGAKFGAFSSGERKKWENRILNASWQLKQMQDIAKDSADLQFIASGMSGINSLNYNYNMSGGYDQRYARAARIGGKLELEWEPEIELNWDIETNSILQFKLGGDFEYEIELDWDIEELLDWLPEFKDGGKVESESTDEEKELQVDTNQMNVIPEGALHKNKHHIENTESFTQKGIPVIDNEGELQAEIECNEIIFTLEVTKKLEDWYKEFYDKDTANSRKDELAILAGKLLVEQILYNTDDRTGLIDTLKNGGNIPIINKDFEKSNNVSQDEITNMVKQALLNLLIK